MIDLWPRRAIPSWIRKENRKDFCLVASGLTLLVLAVTVPRNLIFGTEETNYLVSLFSSLRNIVHPQAFPCPFCGGTRAFLLCSDLKLIQAASFSFPAIIVFVSMCTTTPLRLLLLLRKEWSGAIRVRRLLDLHDRTTLQITVLLAAWSLQVLLHYTEFFPSVIFNEFEWCSYPLC